jgi:rhamnogalacturonan endolyase
VIKLSWSVLGITPKALEIMRDTDPQPAGRERIGFLNSGTEFVDNNVTAGTTYYYWIKATETDGSVINSAAVSAMLEDAANDPNVSGLRQMERLDRGIVALKRDDKNVYVSWRLFATDVDTLGFNLYRSTGGSTPVKLNGQVITATTDYLDKEVDTSQSNTYFIRPVQNGIEQSSSESFTLDANTPARQYLPITLKPISDGDYSVQHVYVGDIDGDGDYDYVVKRFLVSSSKTGTIKLDCYDNEGVFKWRIDLGPNIETTNSPMTSPVLVYDFDGDGKAEILAKTGEQTTFGNGATIGDTNRDGVTDYNSYIYEDYAHILKGPEFISMIDGESGAELTRANFIDRGDVCDWGDCYGARVNFIMATVAYLDGVHPSAVFSRGPGNHMVVEAWDFSQGSLHKRWAWNSMNKSFASGTEWVDFHQVKAVDVDHDGKDEISWGSGMLDDNGKVLYTTKLVHGDRFQIGDLNPSREGLEVYAIQQNNQSLLGAALYDAETGSILREWYTSSLADIGRGDVADIDPDSLGMELFSLADSNLQNSQGDNISSSRPYPDLSIWWDGDLGREFFVGIGSGGYNPAINKWNSTTDKTDRLFTIYNDGGPYVVTVPYAGRAPYIGDIIGDWREEVVLETKDHKELRVYSTTIPAQDRIYTLMQNPAYRIDVTTKGYLCSKLPDFYLGYGMKKPPVPNIKLK